MFNHFSHNLESGNFHISKIFILLDVYLDPIHWPAPCWLVSSIGRVLHWYRRGHGFKSRMGLNFFQVLFTTTRFSSVLSCEDLLISSLHRSANIWIFIYLKSSIVYCSLCFDGDTASLLQATKSKCCYLYIWWSDSTIWDKQFNAHLSIKPQQTPALSVTWQF